jgi:hypothetical protein
VVREDFQIVNTQNVQALKQAPRLGLQSAGELAPTVELRVSEAEPYAKGDSATSSYKQCTLESGARLAVPPYVQAGDTVVVDTRSATFVKRG